MIPCDSDDIRKEYGILLNELELFNPELLDKPRMLAITKSDLIDEGIKELLVAELPDDLPVLFISSVAQTGLTELKDAIWDILNKPVE